MNDIGKWIKKNLVFLVSVFVSLIVIVYGAVNSSGLADLSGFLMDKINKGFSWLYLLIMFGVLIFLIVIAFSKFGNVKLGKDSDKPEYSFSSWFAMLFCAGTGIGLVFWSIAEPLTHYVNPQDGIEPGTEEAVKFSIRTCFLHWGFIPWACFTLVGMGLAYFSFRKDKPALISSIFIPLIGENKARGIIGHIVDFFSVIVTVAGVATSLGLGCMQINGGLNYMFNIPDTKISWLIIILAVTVIYMFSALSGINNGIKFLSNANSWLAIACLITALVIGPTSNILSTFVNGLGDHISNFVHDSLSMSPIGDKSWVINWRVFYWAWWIAWAPFVGMFIARISKGRTIKEFVIGVLVVPALFTFIWYSVFGCLALSVTGDWSLEALAEISSHPETAVFIVLEKYPAGNILSIGIIALLAIFFITSADSATLSLSILSSNGNANPSAWRKLVWGVIEAATAYILLCSGGLKPLQTISIAAALPFLFIMVFIAWSLVKSLRNESGSAKQCRKE